MDTSRGPIPLCCTVNAIGHCVKCYRRYCIACVKTLKMGKEVGGYDSFAVCECGLLGDRRWKAFAKEGMEEKLVPE